MARGQTLVDSRDGGLGYTGPGGIAPWAAIGVASRAQPAATQRPVFVSNADDVETLFGRGPLRDALVLALSATGGLVLAVPLQRSTGGEAIGAGTAIVSGSLSVTPLAAGYSFGQEHVALEVVTGGPRGTAAFRFIVDGVAGPTFTPTADDLYDTAGSAVEDYAPGRANLGELAFGVPDAGLFTLQITFGTGTEFVAGDMVEWRMSEPKAAAADVLPSAIKLADHPFEFEWIELTGITSAATQHALHTEVRGWPMRGNYVHVHTSRAGPDLRTGAAAAAASTPAWVSDAASATDPERLPNPRLAVWEAFVPVDDPITGWRKVVPAMYDALGLMARREPWDPVDEVGRDGTASSGRLPHALGLYPADLAGSHIDTLDNAWYCTVTEITGRVGVYVTHGRMWSTVPRAGLTGSDFSSTELRRTMDVALRRVRSELLPRQNSRIVTGPDGRMSVATRAAWQADAAGVLDDLVKEGAMTAPTATVVDEAPGILEGGTVIVTVEFIPFGKAERIRGFVAFSRGRSTEEAA